MSTRRSSGKIFSRNGVSDLNDRAILGEIEAVALVSPDNSQGTQTLPLPPHALYVVRCDAGAQFYQWYGELMLHLFLVPNQRSGLDNILLDQVDHEDLEPL